MEINRFHEGNRPRLFFTSASEIALFKLLALEELFPARLCLKTPHRQSVNRMKVSTLPVFATSLSSWDADLPHVLHRNDCFLVNIYFALLPLVQWRFRYKRWP